MDSYLIFLVAGYPAAISGRIPDIKWPDYPTRNRGIRIFGAYLDINPLILTNLNSDGSVSATLLPSTPLPYFMVFAAYEIEINQSVQ